MTVGGFSWYSEALASVKGMPSCLIFRVGIKHVQQMLELACLALTQRSDMLMCVLGTVIHLRANEIDQLQICYV